MTELPSNWQMMTLGDVANWTSGGTPSSKNPKFYDGEIPWVCIGDLNESYVFNTAKKITHEGLNSSSAKIMPTGTVMLAMYATSIGDTGIMGMEMATNQAIACGVPEPQAINGKFLLFYLQSQKHEFFAAGRGGAQPNINQGIVKGWPIPVPPMNEQIKIVEMLEDHLSRLDAALADVKQAKVKVAQFRRSAIHYAYQGLSASRLGDHIELIMGQAPPGSACNKQGVGVPFVKVGEFGDVHPETVEWTTKPLKMAKVGDVLLCVVGATIGKINQGIDCAIGRSVAAIRSQDIRQRYLMYFLELQMMEIRSKSKGSAQGVITKEMINSMTIPLPDRLEDQDKILLILDSQLEKVSLADSLLSLLTIESTDLRRSLLQAAFTGQLTKEVASV